MEISLSPVRGLPDLTVVKAGNKLTINGELFDFSSMVDGDVVPESAITSAWFEGPVTNTAGELTLTLRMPVGATQTQAQAFPQPLLNVPDGTVVFP